MQRTARYSLVPMPQAVMRDSRATYQTQTPQILQAVCNDSITGGAESS